jgi:hypothetical protein
VSRAWNNVTSTTIENCWKKADILPKYEDEINMEDYEDRDILLELERLKEQEEVQVLINKLDFDEVFTADEFIKYDESEPTNEMVSDEEILNGILPNEKEKDEDEDENPLPTISHNEAIESYNKIILYLEQHEEDFNIKGDELKSIKRLRKEALKQQFITARQTNLNNFVSIIE